MPESFNVLVKELQGLCLKVDLIDRDNRLVNAEEALTAELHRDDEATYAGEEIAEEAGALSGSAAGTPEGDLYKDKELMEMLSADSDHQEPDQLKETDVHELESGVEIEIELDELEAGDEEV